MGDLRLIFSLTGLLHPARDELFDKLDWHSAGLCSLQFSLWVIHQDGGRPDPLAPGQAYVHPGHSFRLTNQVRISHIMPFDKSEGIFFPGLPIQRNSDHPDVLVLVVFVKLDILFCLDITNMAIRCPEDGNQPFVGLFLR